MVVAMVLQWYCNGCCNAIAIGNTYKVLFCRYFIRLLARINKCATRAQQKCNIVAMGVAIALQLLNFYRFVPTHTPK
jgi:hypothetical protein